MPIIKTRQNYDATVALNYSGSKMLLQSPLHYLHWLQEEKKDTPALALGRALHAKVLQPNEAADIYAVAPEVDRRTKDGKAIWESFTQANEGKAIITQEQNESLENMAKAIAGIMLANGITFATTELMGQVDYGNVPLKFAIDAVGNDGYLYDIKTTNDDATPRSFKNTAFSFRYHLQAYFYAVCYNLLMKQAPKGFRFIVVEKNAPNGVAIFEMGPGMINLAAADFELVVKLYAECLNQKAFPGYSTDPQVIDVEQIKGGLKWVAGLLLKPPN